MIAQSLISSGGEVERKKELENARNQLRALQDLQKEAIEVEARIRSDIRRQGQDCSSEIEGFEDKLKYYFIDLKQKNIYRYSTGVNGAMASSVKFEDEIATFEKELADFEYFARMFEFSDKTAQAVKNMELIKNEVGVVKKTLDPNWKVARIV